MRISPAWLSFLRRFVIACGIVGLIAGVTMYAGDAYEKRTFDNTPKVHLPSGTIHATAPGKPANYLLIGVDTRTTNDVGSNADVMMVLHVEPATHTGFLVSFPRDLTVNIPGHGQRLLNAAYGLGGAQGAALAIQTLETNFPPLTIQHYIEVDWGGFRQIVNAIGHIHLWFPTPAHDPYSGLDANQAGCLSVDGVGALAYARSRHYYVPDNITNPAPWQWHWTNTTPGSEKGYANGWSATGSDTDRIPRQQYFLRTIAQAAIDKTASNPTKLFGLLDAVSKNFKMDDTLKLGELKQLIRTFNGLNPARVDMQTLPNKPDAQNVHLLVKQPDANAVINRLANLPPPPRYIPTALPPNKVRVRVVNGTGEKGLAARVLSQFTAGGFVAAGPPADADNSGYAKTQIRFAPGKGSAGVTALIASGTSNIAQALSAQDTLGGDVLVIVGRDWDSLTHHFVTSSPTGTTVPGASTSSSTSSSTTTTTTTVPKLSGNPRYLPLDPKTGGPLVGCPRA